MSKSTKPVLVKAKDTNILILMVYAFIVTFPPSTIWLHLQIEKIVSVTKIYQDLGKTTSICLPQFHALTGCDPVSHFLNYCRRIPMQHFSLKLLVKN